MKLFNKVVVSTQRLPGVWFDYYYQDRRKEECCRVIVVEATLFTFCLSVEWLPSHKEIQ